MGSMHAHMRVRLSVQEAQEVVLVAGADVAGDVAAAVRGSEEADVDEEVRHGHVVGLAPQPCHDIRQG